MKIMKDMEKETTRDAPESPLDVPSIKTDISPEEIVTVVREGRRADRARRRSAAR